MESVAENSHIVISRETIDRSQSFVGQWNRLVSTTNWKKGEIILQWRKSLEEASAQSHEYSDEAWSQLAGGVTSQHVGRLRRTYQRFGHVYLEYDGIYWSHFYAALEWDDAEMWLEGAVQNKWSVSSMRKQRWETLGQLPDQRPDDRDIVASEINEENQSLELSERKRLNDRDYIEGPVYEGPDFGEEDTKDQSRKKKTDPASDDSGLVSSTSTIIPEFRPFESFENLPEDVDEAANNFKLSIIRHRADQWQQIKQDDMIALLEALKQLAQQP